jgi:hypothetical protein
MLNQIVKMVGVGLAVLLGFMLLIWLLRVFTMVVSLVFGLLILVFIFYLVSSLFKIPIKAEETKRDAFKLVDFTQPSVALFAAEPSVSELLGAQELSGLREASAAGCLVEVDNDTEVIVLDDSRQKDAVHVRVAGGQHKGREGWVCRSVLQKSTAEKLLPG